MNGYDVGENGTNFKHDLFDFEVNKIPAIFKSKMSGHTNEKWGKKICPQLCNARNISQKLSQGVEIKKMPADFGNMHTNEHTQMLNDY